MKDWIEYGTGICLERQESDPGSTMLWNDANLVARRSTGFRQAISVAVMILLSAAYDNHTNCQAQGLLLHICELGDKHTHTHALMIEKKTIRELLRPTQAMKHTNRHPVKLWKVQATCREHDRAGKKHLKVRWLSTDPPSPPKKGKASSILVGPVSLSFITELIRRTEHFLNGPVLLPHTRLLTPTTTFISQVWGRHETVGYIKWTVDVMNQYWATAQAGTCIEASQARAG